MHTCVSCVVCGGICTCVLRVRGENIVSKLEGKWYGCYARIWHVGVRLLQWPLCLVPGLYLSLSSSFLVPPLSLSFPPSLSFSLSLSFLFCHTQIYIHTHTHTHTLYLSACLFVYTGCTKMWPSRELKKFLCLSSVVLKCIYKDMHTYVVKYMEMNVYCALNPIHYLQC